MYLLFVILVSTATFGKTLQRPSDWAEMNSIGPVILTWVKAMPDKKLSEVPTIQVQQYTLQASLVKFIQEKIDSDNCRQIEEDGWNQSWCLRKNKIMVILSRGENAELVEVKESVKSWVLSHD